MNINEDYRYYIRKRLQSANYHKDLQKNINSLEDDSNPLVQFYQTQHANQLAQASTGNRTIFDRMKDQSIEINVAPYQQMSKEEIETLINEKIMPSFRTWVQNLFEGQLISIIKCLTCERLSTREETFMNLSVDIEKNTSLSHCLKKFSTKELLNMGDKFYCEGCNAK